MKVLLTGGAGYVGYSLVQQLLKINEIEEVTVYDNLSRKNYNFFINGQFSKDKLRFIKGEMLDSRLLDKEVDRTDAIIHLAAKVLTPFADIDAHFVEQVNHWGTAGLVTLAEKSDISSFTYLSSLSVYGNVSEEVDETAPLRPKSFYGVSKKRGEDHVMRLLEKGVNTHIIRSGNVYGYNPCIRFDAVMNRFMFDAHINNRISIHGNGEQHRAFIHVDKLASTLAGLLIEKIPAGIYNIAEHNISVNEIAGLVENLNPGLEKLYINQHLQMRELKVKLPVKLSKFLRLPERSIEDELAAYKQEFSF